MGSLDRDFFAQYFARYLAEYRRITLGGGQEHEPSEKRGDLSNLIFIKRDGSGGGGLSGAAGGGGVLAGEGSDEAEDGAAVVDGEGAPEAEELDDFRVVDEIFDKLGIRPEAFVAWRRQRAGRRT